MTNCNKCGRPVGGSSMYCSACYDEMEQNARLDFENTQLRARIAELEKQVSGLVAHIDEVQERLSERISELEEVI